MSPQIVVDEQIDHGKVTVPLKRWITAEQIGYEVGHKGFSDEQITSLLLRLKRRTLVTIDREFYRRQLRHIDSLKLSDKLFLLIILFNFKIIVSSIL